MLGDSLSAMRLYAASFLLPNALAALFGVKNRPLRLCMHAATYDKRQRHFCGLENVAE